MNQSIDNAVHRDAIALKQYYSARAIEYDGVYSKPERQPDLRQIEHWLPSRYVDCNVLEIACGTGHWTQFIAPVARSITAIDAAQETLDIARARVSQPHVAFTIGDAYAPSTEQCHDAAFAGFWFSHVPVQRQQEFLQTLSRSLVPGARIVILDNRYVPGSSSLITETDGEGNTYQLRALRDGSSHRILKNFPTQDRLLELISTFGNAPRLFAWEFFWAFEFTVA